MSLSTFYSPNVMNTDVGKTKSSLIEGGTFFEAQCRNSVESQN